MAEYTIRTKHASVMAIDQHARSVTIAGLCLPTAETRTTRLSDCPTAADIASWAATWANLPIRFAYESGPCGFQLACDLRSLGYDCDIIAVSSIPKSASDRRLKDDRRDAHRLLDAVVSPNSKCRCVFVPSEEAEAARDLVRSYFDMVAAAKRLKLQFSGMLLRHGIVWNERTSAGRLRTTWTRQYISWARGIVLSESAANDTLRYYLGSTLEAIERCAEVKKSCLELASSVRFKPYVDAMTRLKGVDDIVALAYISTVDDFSRFKNGRSVSSYFGFTPSRNDSGEKIGRNGPITKAGDTTVHRAVIEGLSSLPNFNAAPKPRREGRSVSLAVETEAMKCNGRNRTRYQDLVKAGKKPNVAKVAVASELVREMWVLGCMVERELEGGS